MVEYKEYKLTYQQLMSKPYAEVINYIYDCIPSHHIVEIDRATVADLIGYYPKLYSALSHHFSLLLEKYEARVEGKTKDLKNALEQAMKVVKMQYETLSRKITVDKEEEGMWKTSSKK